MLFWGFLSNSLSGLTQFYQLSSNYYYGAGAAITVLVGLVITAITGRSRDIIYAHELKGLKDTILK